MAGTSVRTVRYYHQMNLVPVPQVRYGHRDYELMHLARVIRIRWLVQAGVPLVKIGGMLDQYAPAAGNEADRARVLVDLRATRDELDSQIARLTRQRDRLDGLATAVESGAPLSVMPPAVVRFYDEMERRADSVAVRREIRRERDFTELAYFRGDLPVESQVLYEGFDESAYGESLSVFGRIAGHSDSAAPNTPEETDAIVAAVIDRISRRVGSDRTRLARSIDHDMAARAAALFVRTSPPSERKLSRAVADAILTALTQWRG